MALLRWLAGGLVVVLLWAANPATAADLFGRPEAPAAESATPAAEPPAAAVNPQVLPEPLRSVLGRVLAVQNHLNAELRTQLQLAKGGDSWHPALVIVALSFLYGVFHAIGPGHGKLVVGSYFLTRRARLLHGLAMSGAAAFVQALAAVALVGLLAAAFDLGSRQILAQAAGLETFSYGVIVVLGLWMGWGVVSGRNCCAHDHGGPHDADCHHHHDHGEGDACHHHPAEAEHARPTGRSELMKVLTTGAAVGLRPCSGAILVLLFTLANDIFPVGILAAFAMGVGVAITVSVVSLTTLGVHRSLAALGEARQVERLRQAAALAGAAVITLFGVLQLIGIWTGAITPMAG